MAMTLGALPRGGMGSARVKISFRNPRPRGELVLDLWWSVVEISEWMGGKGVPTTKVGLRAVTAMSEKMMAGLFMVGIACDG